MDLSAVVSNPDFAEAFTILRSAITYGSGGLVNVQTIVNMYGVISQVDPKELLMIPEADKVTGAILVHSTQQMYTTNAAAPGVSDIIVWQNEQYRVRNVSNYSTRDYWRAMATRMAGN